MKYISYIFTKLTTSIYPAVIMIILTALLICLLIMTINTRKKIKKLNERFEVLTQGIDGISIEKLLSTYGKDIKDIHRDMILDEERKSKIELKQSFAMQKLGFIRYNAFEDSKSELSFSIVLLDDYNNGFVLSAINGRESCVSYAKAVKNGKSTVPLSEEEKSALEKALTGV